MFTALRPQPGPQEVSGARDQLASAITGAPDRHRVSRVTWFAATGGLVAAAAATVTAVTLTIGSAPPARASVTTALTRTLAQSYHLTWQNSIYYIMNGQIRAPSRSTCTWVVDPVRHLRATTCTTRPISRDIEAGGYTYHYYADLQGHPGKHWERMPTASLLKPSEDAIVTATPQQMLSKIKKAAKITVAGPVSGPGWTGTRYAFRGGSARQDAISGTVDVDRQGRTRALVMVKRDTSTSGNVFVLTQVLTFSDFGARVTVTPPPADQTFKSAVP
jgi:hypothetical protein